MCSTPVNGLHAEACQLPIKYGIEQLANVIIKHSTLQRIPSEERWKNGAPFSGYIRIGMKAIYLRWLEPTDGLDITGTYKNDAVL